MLIDEQTRVQLLLREPSPDFIEEVRFATTVDGFPITTEEAKAVLVIVADRLQAVNEGLPYEQQ